jgi:hypothetical protein
MNSKRDSDRALFVANRIVQAAPHEWPRVFMDLRRRKHLSEIVRRLNKLLEEPAHRDLARSALRRFGLEHAG